MAIRRIRILDRPKRRIDPEEIARRLGGKLCDPPPKFAQLAAMYLSQKSQDDETDGMNSVENRRKTMLKAIAGRDREAIYRYAKELSDKLTGRAPEGGKTQTKCDPAFPRVYNKSREVWDDLVAEHKLSPAEEEDFRYWCCYRNMDLDQPNPRHLDSEFLLWLIVSQATPFDYLVLAIWRTWVILKGLLQ
jgi:hypothetical protein